MRKGISPLIAAVLMIAFTMAVAALFAQWAPQLMEETMEGQDEEMAEMRDCTGIQFDIDHVDEDNGEPHFRQTMGEDELGEVEVTFVLEDDIAETEANVTDARLTPLTDANEDIDDMNDIDGIDGHDVEDIQEITASSVRCDVVPDAEWEPEE